MNKNSTKLNTDTADADNGTSALKIPKLLHGKEKTAYTRRTFGL